MSTYNLLTKFGNPSKDNYVSTDDAGTESFYSYGTLIGKKSIDGKLELTRHWNYSQTTNFYRKQWTGYSKPETDKRIEQGKITLI